MPPRKKAETKPESPKASTPELDHNDGCKSPRIEQYKSGGFAVVRCQECGARKTN